MENVTGASIFNAYVFAALVLTAYIIFGIYGASKSADRRKNVPSYKVQVVAAAAAISFSVLSYHMMRFLIVYYRLWAFLSGRKVPVTLAEVSIGKLDLWTWLKESTPFRSFAETICNDPARFWWTQSALMYSLGWSIYMASEGTQRRVPHLWAYFFLAQILPTSFTQNLFTLATLFQTSPSSKKLNEGRPAPRQTTRIIQVSLVVIVFSYFWLLRYATQRINTVLFMPIVLLTRFFLFTPYLLLASPPMKRFRVHIPRAYSTTVAAGSCAALMLRQAMVFKKGNGFAWTDVGGKLLTAIHEAPSVSALGYDFIIGAMSLVVFRAIKTPGDI